MNFWSILTVVFFLVIFTIQFALFFMLYQAIRKSLIKITDVESLMSVTAERVMALKAKVPVVTYQEVVKRLKEGEGLFSISEELKIELEELEALQRVLKAVQKQKQVEN